MASYLRRKFALLLTSNQTFNWAHVYFASDDYNRLVMGMVHLVAASNLAFDHNIRGDLVTCSVCLGACLRRGQLLMLLVLLLADGWGWPKMHWWARRHLLALVICVDLRNVHARTWRGGLIGWRLLAAAMQASRVHGPDSSIRIQTAALRDHIATSCGYIHLLLPQHRISHLLLLLVLFALAADNWCRVVCQSTLCAFP